MKSTIKKWGNSVAIRIPAAVMKAVEFDIDEIVDVRERVRLLISALRSAQRCGDVLVCGQSRGHRVTELSAAGRARAGVPSSAAGAESGFV
jgi:antitoxin MazE